MSDLPNPATCEHREIETYSFTGGSDAGAVAMWACTRCRQKFAPKPWAIRPEPIPDTPSLREMRALSEAATPGPWMFKAQDEEALVFTDETPPTLVAIPRRHNPKPDAAFIVAAVNYVRAALAERGTK